MRILATGETDPAAPRRRAARAGFSLVELMAAVVIIGLAAGAVAMVLPSGGPTLEQDVRRFAGGLDRIARHSVMTGRMIGLRIEPEGYRAYRRRRGVWDPLTGDDAAGDWRKGTRVTVGQGAQIRREPISRRDKATREKQGRKKQGVSPQIRFDPLGMGTPFWLRFERGTEAVIVQSNGDGSIEMVEAADGPR
ncbi:MAG: type II secretion system minor pseudopilin GspH [Alphaproteobacteria bacterium]